MQKNLCIFLLVIFLLSCPFILKAEKILVEGNVTFLSANKINGHLFILYSKYKGIDSGKIFLKEFDLNGKELREKELGIKGASAYLSYFNDRFYISYTSLEKEGNVRIAEFDKNWNFLRDILVTPTPYDGEVAYQLIPLNDNFLYLFYARNWKKDCGLKMVKFNRYLEPIEEITLMRGERDFHIHKASQFFSIFANDRLYIAYKGYVPLKKILGEEIKELQKEANQLKTEIQKIERQVENLKIVREALLEEVERDTKKIQVLDEEIKKKISQLEGLNQELQLKEKEIEDKRKDKKEVKDVSVMSVFINEYSLEGNLIRQRNIGAKESLSPSLSFEDGRFYLAYEEYDDKLMKPIIHLHQYDSNWRLIRKTKIITGETGMPRSKAIIVSEGRCYLVTISERREANKIFLKEINFDLEIDEVRL